MKLNDLRSCLRADRVDLYIEKGKPIKYEILGLDDETEKLAEYRRFKEVEEEEGDTMFLKYGESNIEEIGTDEENIMWIVIRK